jgi:hypothetical protein
MAGTDGQTGNQRVIIMKDFFKQAGVLLLSIVVSHTFNAGILFGNVQPVD